MVYGVVVVRVRGREVTLPVEETVTDAGKSREENDSTHGCEGDDGVLGCEDVGEGREDRL